MFFVKIAKPQPSLVKIGLFLLLVGHGMSQKANEISCVINLVASVIINEQLNGKGDEN
jgi:hypothetical protein